MKVLILAGGLGTRLSEITEIRPKPMTEIGGKPILWHIMKMYAHFGFREFVILLGYKGYFIKEYFANYFLHQSNVTFDLKTNKMSVHSNASEDWQVTLLDTGIETMTGGRILRAKNYICNEPFLCTYGDGVSNVNIQKLVEFHKSHGKSMTLTSIRPEGRYGALEFGQNDSVNRFVEKPKGDNSWINGGFFVCEPKVMDYIEGDRMVFEKYPMEKLAKNGELFAYKHEGFWHCMDTLRDKNSLENLWKSNQAQWKLW